MMHSTLVRLAAAAAGLIASWPASVPAQTPFAPFTERGGLVFVSGILPAEPVQGDFAAQAAQVLNGLKARLEGAGTSMDQVVSTSVYLADPRDFGALNTIWSKHWPASPPARTTVVARLPAAGARIQVSAIAAHRGTVRALVLPKGWAPPSGPLSYGVRAGGVLFLSGLVPRRGADGSPGRPNPNLSSAIRVGPWLFLSGMLGVLPGNASDAAGQTAETLGRLGRTMSAAGFRWPDVAESIVYVTDMASATEVLKAFAGSIPGNLPAGTVVGTGLVSPEGRVEIMLTAAK